MRPPQYRKAYAAFWPGHCAYPGIYQPGALLRFISGKGALRHGLEWNQGTWLGHGGCFLDQSGGAAADPGRYGL